MSNPNSPFGFQPLRHLTSGTPGRYGYNYTIADALASNLAQGDLVKRTGTGKNIDLAPDGVGGAPAVGVFMGCKYRNVYGEIFYRPFWVASTATYNNEGAKAIVIDDPRTVFRLRASGSFAVGDSGQFAGLVIGTPNLSTGVSTTAFNSSDITGTLDNVKLLDLYTNSPNAYGNYAVAEVVISFHEYGDGTYRAS